MPTTHRRLAVAGILTAAAVAVPAAALAAASDSPHPKPQHPAATASASGKSEAAAPDLSALAASAGISVSRLEAGLRALKPAGGNTTAGVAAFAAAAGVSNATAHRIVDSVLGAEVNSSVTGPAATAVLASHLGVSKAAAQRALQQVAALADQNGVDPPQHGIRDDRPRPRGEPGTPGCWPGRGQAEHGRQVSRAVRRGRRAQ